MLSSSTLAILVKNARSSICLMMMSSLLLSKVFSTRKTWLRIDFPFVVCFDRDLDLGSSVLVLNVFCIYLNWTSRPQIPRSKVEIERDLGFVNFFLVNSFISRSTPPSLSRSLGATSHELAFSLVLKQRSRPPQFGLAQLYVRLLPQPFHQASSLAFLCRGVS